MNLSIWFYDVLAIDLSEILTNIYGMLTPLNATLKRC